MSSSVSLSQTDVRPRRRLHVSLWIAQILLAGMFGMVGFMKIATPIAVLAQKMAWVTGAPARVRFIGICELAGSIDLILPAAFTDYAQIGRDCRHRATRDHGAGRSFPPLPGRSQAHCRAGLAGRAGCLCRLGAFPSRSDFRHANE
jgi:hypothetical protein